jgi:hypothetical protein
MSSSAAMRSRCCACCRTHARRWFFFDPQFRAVLDKLKFGNESARQRGRAGLPAMSEDYIDSVCPEIARVLAPSGYLMHWVDTFGLCQAHHLRILRQHVIPFPYQSDLAM